MEALALKAYAGYTGLQNDADYEFGLRGSAGYEFSDCLFVKFTGFGYSTDLYDYTQQQGSSTSSYSQEYNASYFDLVVGQRFTPSDNFSLSPYAGLRSLYGTAKQSVVFGTNDQSNSSTSNGELNFSNSSSSDDVLFISELGLGMQYDFSFSNIASNVRLGVEGQLWAGAGNGEGGGEDMGLAGFVVGANFRF